MDPDYNARLGGWYLRQQLDQFGGMAPLALAAYNAGPARVTQWLQANGDPRRGSEYDMIDWIELIPFSETRNYVQRVMEAMQVYRALIESGKLRMTGIQRTGIGGSVAEAPAGKSPS
jgi:soluble lytic murein transglycosylase